jgi:hypothetical protein
VTTRRDPVTGRKIAKGDGHWKHWRKDIRRLFLNGASNVRFTTVFDLYCGAWLLDPQPPMRQERRAVHHQRQLEQFAQERAMDFDELCVITAGGPP